MSNLESSVTGLDDDLFIKTNEEKAELAKPLMFFAVHLSYTFMVLKTGSKVTLMAGKRKLVESIGM